MLPKTNQLPNRLIFNRTSKLLGDHADYTTISIINRTSKKLPDVHFTNFLSGQPEGDANLKRLLKKINDMIKINQWQSSAFEITPLHDYNKTQTDRLLRIANSYGTLTIRDISELFKCKLKSEKNLQIYIKPDNANLNLAIVLVDVRHLALAADYYVGNNTFKPANPEKVYAKFENRNYCISNIFS